MAEKKVITVELIHLRPDNKIILYFYQRCPRGLVTRRKFVNPRLRNVARVARSVHANDFMVRPFLAGDVGWVATRNTHTVRSR